MATDDRSVLRDRTGRFQPGTATPNPGGRPRVPDELRAIFEAASTEAARKLAELVHDDDPRVALVASNAILDRVLGKPAQQVNASAASHDLGRIHLEALQEIQARGRRALELKPDDPEQAN